MANEPWTVNHSRPYRDCHYSEQVARDIVAQGSQITLPFEAGDAQVTFSRYRLAEMIREALLDGEMD